jgi:hypothetical protein
MSLACPLALLHALLPCHQFQSVLRRLRFTLVIPVKIIKKVVLCTRSLSLTCWPVSGGHSIREASGRATGRVSAPFPFICVAVLTEIHLCDACSCQEILRLATARQYHPID